MTTADAIAIHPFELNNSYNNKDFVGSAVCGWPHSPVDGPGVMPTLYVASHQASVTEELVGSSLMEMQMGGVSTVPCLLCTKHR